MSFCTPIDTSGKALEDRKPVKRALFIGIVYQRYSKKAAANLEAHPVNLRGPHKDCNMLSQFIQERYGYKKEDITMLLDTKDNMRRKKFSHLRPTRVNILREISKLVEGARPGDHFFFHYSGHGDQVPCNPGDIREPDGMDETIVPCDAKYKKGTNTYITETLILDNLMHELMVKPLHKGCHLTAVYDMCHAGTALDLEHYDCNRALPPLWWRSSKTNIETQDAALLSRTQSMCIPDASDAGGNEDIPSTSFARIIPGRQPRRRSHIGEQTNRIQPAGRNIQQEVAKTTYIEGHAAQGKPGKQKLEIRTRSMSWNQEDPKEPTETKTMTTRTKTTHSSSPTRRQPHICRTCSLPLSPIQERSNSLAPSFTSALHQTERADELPLVQRPSSLPAVSKKDKHVLGCIRVRRLSWPSKFFKRFAGTADGPLNGGEHVKKSPTPAKATSEGSIMNKPMFPIQEDQVVDSPTTYLEQQRMSSPEPMTCTCIGAMNEAGYPDVISIASCSDEQSTFEGPQGLSVTQTLIDILAKDPHPTYKQLMEAMSYSLYKQAQDMLTFYRDRSRYREGMKNKRKSSVLSGPDADYISAIIESAKDKDEDTWEEFVTKYEPVQDPQLGSQRRLNLNDKFSP